MLDRKYVSPRMLIQMAKQYIEMINQGAAPNIESVWGCIVRNEKQQIMKNSID